MSYNVSQYFNIVQLIFSSPLGSLAHCGSFQNGVFLYMLEGVSMTAYEESQ